MWSSGMHMYVLYIQQFESFSVDVACVMKFIIIIIIVIYLLLLCFCVTRSHFVWLYKLSQL